MTNDITAETERLRVDRDRWRKVAEQLATELGKTEYAKTEYENLLNTK